MGLRIHPDDLGAIYKLLADIQDLENRSHRLCMTQTGHALNEAKNKAGWELADQISELRGKQPLVSQ